MNLCVSMSAYLSVLYIHVSYVIKCFNNFMLSSPKLLDMKSFFSRRARIQNLLLSEIQNNNLMK